MALQVLAAPVQNTMAGGAEVSEEVAVEGAVVAVEAAVVAVVVNQNQSRVLLRKTRKQWPRSLTTKSCRKSCWVV